MVSGNMLSVIWFEHLRSKNQKYGYGSFSIMKISSQTEQVERENVIHSFDNLTGKAKLPVSVLRFLDEYADIDWRMENKSDKTSNSLSLMCLEKGEAKKQTENENEKKVESEESSNDEHKTKNMRMFANNYDSDEV
jgi:hypothetical protein